MTSIMSSHNAASLALLAALALLASVAGTRKSHNGRDLRRKLTGGAMKDKLTRKGSWAC